MLVTYEQGAQAPCYQAVILIGVYLIHLGAAIV